MVCLRKSNFFVALPQTRKGLLLLSMISWRFFSGASLVTGVLAAKGIVVGPPLDIGISAEYNLAWEHVMRWVTLLLASKRLNAFMVLTFLMSKPTLEMCWVKEELN